MISFLKKLFSPSVDFKELVQKGAIIIDVRTPSEFDGGHIKNSKNIPLNIISRDIQLIKKMGKPIITVCQSGGRSRMAKNLLKNEAIEVYNGGAWFKLNTKILA